MHNVSLIDTNIDALIEAEKAKLEQLMQARDEQKKKQENLKKLNEEYFSNLRKYGISEYEYFNSKADSIEQWITSVPESSLYAALQKHFAKQAAKQEQQPEKVSTLPKPKLKAGSYRNPATNEVIEKIKRSPKKLEQWVEEYGFPTVRTWKI